MSNVVWRRLRDDFLEIFSVKGRVRVKEILQYMKKKKITQLTKNNKNIIGEKHLPEIFKEPKKQNKKT